ncbi:glycosyltransferase family 2 protein [Quadrisphaera oryzae]|uniref:glycosyltransferase family 2 protein n=1 Tax=Quadrisphaera TaxID=317661 RepID=UPI0016460044|nr:glycosyltransferase [Quadrisphaera sp. RL12-1S]MBC3762509.1 glycosyltransferase family 2 protein [Quadrisphaera sp. RL12-1S]
MPSTSSPDEPLDPRLGVVVITWQRREEALAAVGRLLDLPERPRVVVVDNGSTDGTAGALRRAHPAAVASERLEVVPLAHNAGAVGRNVGVARLAELGLRYAAFCDDDTWWEPGSLARAGDVLDAHPDVAVLTARIVVEPSGREDPIVAELRDSPVVGSRPGLPGPALGSFLAGASVVRVDAFGQVGGFSARLWLGGEEEMCAADLAAAGWELCYLPDLTVHHRASALRDSSLRRRHGIRNTVWFTLLRRPWPAALRRLRVLARQVPKDRTTALAVADAVRGLPWVLRERRPLPPHAEARFLALEDAQTRSTARSYVG